MGFKTYFSKLHYNNNLTVFEKAIMLPLRFCSLFYGAGAATKNFLYNKNILKSAKAPAYIISIGNITTGGTGKTPVCAEIANYFGKKCAVVSRGYKSALSNKHVNVISNGEKIFYNAKQAGDEPYWLAKNTKDACIITSVNRYKGVKFAVKNFNVTQIILDDGFQHRKLKRDLDIVVIDSKMRFSNGFLLPAGALRENINSVKRADKIIVVSKNDPDANAFADELKKKFNKPIIICKMTADKIYDIKTKEETTIKDKRILAFSAIAQPEQFYEYFIKPDACFANLATQVITKTFDDHHKYTKTDIQKLESLAIDNNVSVLVTTEKDAVKIKDFPFTMQICALKLKPKLNIEELLNC